MERKKANKKRKITIIFTSFILISFGNVLLTPYFVLPISADNGNISEAWHNSSSLNVSIVVVRPQIIWYDLQYYNGVGWESRLNQQIDVNNSARYRFAVNITSYQGWDDIEYINISSWYDQRNESSYYNQTPGGNLNLYMNYENTTGTANADMLWPNEEVTFNGFSERIVTNSFTDWPDTETRNISFEFIPGYQFRYAPGPVGGWDTTSGSVICSNESYFNNLRSWNFNISVTDSGENNSGIPLTTWITDEFGVYSYFEVVNAGNPRISGEPGYNYSVNDAGGSGNISIVTRSNGNYSLSANLSDLIHATLPSSTISNESVWLRGGNRTSFKNFSKGSTSNPIYLYGGRLASMPAYQTAENNGTNKTTTNVEYKCYIDFGLQPGTYTTIVYYILRTEL